MAKAPKKPHPEDVLLAQEIVKATEWSACLHLGPGDRHVTRDLPNYAAALTEADRLNTLSRFGRRAMVYAITKLGSFPVDAKLAQLAGLTA